MNVYINSSVINIKMTPFIINQRIYIIEEPLFKLKKKASFAYLDDTNIRDMICLNILT